MLELNILMNDFSNKKSNIEKKDNLLEKLLIEKSQILEKYIDLYNGLQCAIILNHNTNSIITIFKGSDSLIDWFYNALTFKTYLEKNAFVHSGFKYQLFPALDLLIEINKKLINKYKDYNIIITGYSLGGAHCCIFSFNL